MITPSTGDERRGATGPLARYVVAACLARAADAGAAVGLALLALAPTAGASRGTAAAGALAAALTAPHLLAPWVARGLDRSRDGRRSLAAAFALYGAALGSGGALVGRAPLIAALTAVIVAGLCGPLLTGGLSSSLRAIAPGGRAEGIDAVTYGVAGTAGPALVAALAGAASPRVAVLAVAAAAVFAAAVVLTLPTSRPQPARTGADAGVLRLIVARGALRRAGLSTMLTSLGMGGLPLIAAVLGTRLGGGPAAGGALMAALGAGTLAGALLVTAFPATGDPDTRIGWLAAALAAALVLCTVAPAFPAALAGFGLVGALNAPYLAATLAVRSEHAPDVARARVFASMAGMKVAAGSAGAAATGAALALGPRTVLAAAAAIALLAAAAGAADRRLAP